MECFICELRLDRRRARGNWPSACRADRVSCCRVHMVWAVAGGCEDISSACVLAAWQSPKKGWLDERLSVKRGEVRLLSRPSG
jgi:hypothetical protein